MTKIEAGTYSLYQMDDGTQLDVFRVQEVSAEDTNPLHLDRYYYQGPDDSEPVGPFETEKAALLSTVK